MYQLPVGNIEKIRKARKAVKNILSEIGLEDCQTALKDFTEPEAKEENTEEAFNETDWQDVADVYSNRRRKKWPYRSRSLCCNMCKYSSQNIYNFRSHVSRCHGYLESFCALASCSQCLFIAHPKVVKKHMLFFHSKPLAPSFQSQKEATGTVLHGNERYQCRKCSLPSSSIFLMKKHVILKHMERVAEHYIGYRLHQHTKVYCCKVCKLNIGTLDQMLHHMLIEPTHYSVNSQVQSMIYENKNFAVKPAPTGNGMFVTFPNIAPKPQQAQVINNNPLILPANGQPGGTMVAVQQVQQAANSTTLICAPGTNQTFLPPQASALVQLASAEAKGLLQPGATISLRGAVPQGSPVVLPTVSNVSLKQASLNLPPGMTRPQQSPQGQQIVLPPGLQATVMTGARIGNSNGALAGPGGLIRSTAEVGAGSTTGATAGLSVLPQNLQGTMLTSQSLLNHLIPTGNKVNGMPTYTFAPLQQAAPASQRASSQADVENTGNLGAQLKKWITCPLCNELFPSNVFEIHVEVAHPAISATSKSESLAARAAFLKKMPDKTVKCLTCKTLLSERSVFQHLLHGLSCLYCSNVFFSIRQLSEHIKQHNPSSKHYCDFLRQKFRVYTNHGGGILMPYFDVNTTAPKEVLGDSEVNLALVTNSMDLIFVKLQPNSQQGASVMPLKLSSTTCPFCDEKFEQDADHLQHLKQKHFVAPTIHAILKTEAFKCIYCNGVYTGKVTQQAVMLHIQRCRFSPKPPQPPAQAPVQPLQPVKPAPAPQQLLKPAPQLSQTHGLYFLQMPQQLTVAKPLAPARVVPTTARPQSDVDLKSQKRLEAALKEVMELNKREREQKAAMRKRQEREKHFLEKPAPPAEPGAQSSPTVKLALEPTAVERSSIEERKDFLSDYFNISPYPTKAEIEELSRRLSLTKAEIVTSISRKRSKCMKTLNKNSAAILLGFNMTRLSKVKHNLFIPEQQPPPETADVQQSEEPSSLTAGEAEQTGKELESMEDKLLEPMDEQTDEASESITFSLRNKTTKATDSRNKSPGVSEADAASKPEKTLEAMDVDEPTTESDYGKIRERGIKVSKRAAASGSGEAKSTGESGTKTLADGDQVEPME